jgi:hypothetical protein
LSQLHPVKGMALRVTIPRIGQNAGTAAKAVISPRAKRDGH